MDQLGVILGVVAIGGGLLVYALLFLRNGREYREALNEVYVRDPDDLGVPPAVAGYVNRFYELQGDDLAATAMDLVARGVVDLDDDPAYRASRSLLSLRRERAAGLWPHELAALALLLAPCGRLCPLASLDVLHRLNWRDRQVYDERIGEFGGCVIEEVDDLGLAVEAYGFRAAAKVSVITVVMLLFAFVASGLAHTWVFEVAAMVLAGVAYLFDRVMYRRSRPGRILQVRCGHLQRYWHDFGHLGEKHLDEVALWDVTSPSRWRSVTRRWPAGSCATTCTVATRAAGRVAHSRRPGTLPRPQRCGRRPPSPSGCARWASRRGR